MKKIMWFFIITLIVILIIIGVIMVRQQKTDKAKTIAEEYLSKQTYKDAYENKSYIVTEFEEYFEVKFRRKISIPEKGDGLIRVSKETWDAEWIPKK